LLAKDVVEAYGDRAAFVSQDWSESELAARYGVRRYPVVFVDDILLAQPDDFGWHGAKGKYAPWKNRENHEKFKRDLRRMMDLVLGGRQGEAAALGQTRVNEEIAALPPLSARDLAGRAVVSERLVGRVVVVEFWATWCPPCRVSLDLLNRLKKRHGESLAVVAVAVESSEREVREYAKTLDPSFHVVTGTDEVVAPFGSFGSVPRTFVFDRRGKTAGVFYGAPPDLHAKIEALIEKLAR
jgi:cytochrome c biogenesis protein CcmG, thiol:disulfide interchange protein DsbE